MTWVRLGQAANLLDGLRARWDPARPDGCPLSVPPSPGVVTFPATAQPSGGWSMPAVSIHGGAASLADAAFGHRLAGLSLGSLMPAPQVLRFLGLDAEAGGSRPGNGFLLVRVARITGRARYEALMPPPRPGFDRRRHLTAACRRAEAGLRPGPRPGAPHAARLSAADAQRYLDHFARFGTHFVAGVWHGDAIVQAFAFDQGELTARLSASGFSREERVLAGERALACAALIEPAAVRAAGPIISLNGDPAVAASVARGDWDSARARGPSLLEPFAAVGSAALELLNGARLTAPLSLDLEPLCRFLEFYRGRNWQRLLAGGLSQVFGDRVDVPLTAPVDVPAEIGDLLLRPPPGGWAATGSLAVYHERVRGEDLARLPRALSSCAILSHTLELRAGETVPVPGRQVALAAHTLVSPAPSSRRAPRLRCEDAALAELTLIAGDMTGLLTITNRSGTEWRTVIDGLELTTVGETVQIHAVTYRPEPEQLTRIAPLLGTALRTAERLLCHPGSDGDGARARAAAAELLDWLAGLPGPAGDAPRRGAARHRSHGGPACP